MKNENLMDSSFGRIFGPDSSPYELGSHENFEKYCKIRDEMNKFIQNLNHCKHCSSIHTQVHVLYLALIHLENVEKELLTSSLTEEFLYQEKIIEDIHSLKQMVLNNIHDLNNE